MRYKVAMESLAVKWTRKLSLAVVLGTSLSIGCTPAPQQARTPSIPKVSVAKPIVTPFTDYNIFNGRLEAMRSVDVRARVRGHIAKIHFVDGQYVKEGDPLYDLDPRPFITVIDRAKDGVKVLEAKKFAADKEVERQRRLITMSATSQSDLDSAEATSNALASEILAASREVERAELELEYSKIKAEISGRIGRTSMDAGNLVNAGGSDPVLSTIVYSDEMYLYFNLDEKTLINYQNELRAENAGEASAVTLREMNVPIQFGLETDQGYPHQAMLDFANVKIEQSTGTVEVRGVLKNTDRYFVPGARVRVQVPATKTARNVTLVPDYAILADQDRRYLLIVGEGNVIKRLDVVLGRLLEDGQRIVQPRNPQQSLDATTTFVVEGLQMARVNYPVEPIPVVAAAPAPTAPAAPSEAPASTTPAAPSAPPASGSN